MAPPPDLTAVTREAELPGSKLIPAEHARRSLLALKRIGKERKRHVMDPVFDPGLAAFAGLNVIPKRSYLAAYSSKIAHRADLRLMAAWATQVHAAGLPRGASSLYRLLAAKAGREYERAQAKKLFRKLLAVSATVTIDAPRVHVTLDKRAPPLPRRFRLGQPTRPQAVVRQQGTCDRLRLILKRRRCVSSFHDRGNRG